MKNSMTNPVVGMGITYAINGDQYPYTIRTVSESGHSFTATPDEETRSPGIFVPQETAEVRKFTRKADGRYAPVGQRFGFVYLGRRSERDPSF